MEQPSFFPTHPEQPTEAVDTDAIAERIGANARPVEYVDRTSEAARDQGWGPVDLPENKTPALSAPKARRARPYRSSREYGDTEIDGGLPPAGREPYVPLTPEQKRAGKVGIEAARLALNNSLESKEEE